MPQSPEAARKWRDGAKIILAGAIAAEGDLGKLACKVKEDANLPRRLINMDFSWLKYRRYENNPTYKAVVHALTTHFDKSSPIPTSRLSDSDPHDVMDTLPSLLEICMEANLYKNATKEAAQRIAVDHLLRTVFQPGGLFSIEPKATIKLRKSTKGDLDVAIADIVILATAKNKDATAAIRLSRYPPGYSWRGDQSASLDSTALAFVSENNDQTEKGAELQLCFDFGTAHCHRRAIGMKPRIIYGATSFRGNLLVYASEWLDYDQEHIHVVKIATFDLTKPGDVLDAYIMLQLIHDDAQQAFEEYPSEEVQLRAHDQDWFAPPRPKATRRQDESMQDGSISFDTDSSVDDANVDSTPGSISSSESGSTQSDYQQDPAAVRAAMLAPLPRADQVDDFDVYEHIRDEGGDPELAWYAFCKVPPPAPEADLLPHEVQICAAAPKDPVSKALLDEHLQDWGYRGSAVAQWTELVVHSPPPPALDLDADAERLV